MITVFSVEFIVSEVLPEQEISTRKMVGIRTKLIDFKYFGFSLVIEL